MNKNKQAICNCNSDFWKLTKDRKATITKTYFYNGEHHCKGFWNDDSTTFDLPAIFFNY